MRWSLPTQTGKALDLPDVTVAVIGFAPTDVKLYNPEIDHDVSKYIAERLYVNDIQVIVPDVVNAWLDEHPNWDHPEEVGEAMDVNYVIEVDLESFSLYEQNSASLFRGRTVAMVSVYEMDEFGHGDRIFIKEIDFVFPTEIPRSTSSILQSYVCAAHVAGQFFRW